MADRPYRYTGPVASVTLGSGREVQLHPSREVVLPADHPYVRRLVARRHLAPIEAKRPPAPPIARENDGDEKKAAKRKDPSNPNVKATENRELK